MPQGSTLEQTVASDAERAEQASIAFTQLYRRQPQHIWAAPGRVNLIGEHTDYNNGFVLPFALPHCSVAAVADRQDGVVSVTSQNTGETVQVAEEHQVPGGISGWAAYAVGVLWALREAGYAVDGADILVATDIPQGAGLSSSAALELSVAAAIAALYEHQIPPLELAQIAQRAENEFVGMPCGLMDQMVSMLGEPGKLVLFDTQHLQAELVPFPFRDARLLVIDSQAPHRLVDGEYAARRAQCEEAAQVLGVKSLREITDTNTDPNDVLDDLTDPVLKRRARHIITENERVLQIVPALAQGQTQRVGELMNASHESLRDDFEISVDEVDLAQQTLIDHGAFGARITGGGFGGCVVALVPTSNAPDLIEAVRQAYADARYSQPQAFIAEPSAGARALMASSAV